MERVILHCDLNCFYASVEMLYHPEFRRVPMAVAGDPKNRHGIILAKNVPAKQKGIKTAETIGEAKRKCPNLIILTPDYDSYSYFSQKVRELYYEYTDYVEPFGPDECWLDISGSVKYFGGVDKIVKEILYRVKNEIGLTLSIGVANNKIYAKLGSDLASEDNFFYVKSLKDIENLPAGSLLGIGYHSAQTLKEYGISTIGDLANKPCNYLKTIMGKCGETFYYFANGFDLSEVKRFNENDDPIKSIGNSLTAVRDLYDLDDIRLILNILSESVSARCKKQGFYFKTVTISVRNKKLECHTAQRTLNENTDLAKDIYDNALSLFKNNYDFTIPYRSIGVSVTNLSLTKQASQCNLFDNKIYSMKQKRQEIAIENIRSRFGHSSIFKLRQLIDTDLANCDPENEHTFYPTNYSRSQ